MNGHEFWKRLKRYGHRNGQIVWFDPVQGHGSHGMVHFGERKTVLKDRTKEIGTGLLRKMLKDLGIDPKDF